MVPPGIFPTSRSLCPSAVSCSRCCRPRWTPSSGTRAIDRFGRREFRDAEARFGADDWEWPFSFRNICEELGIDGERLRATLWRWRAALLDSETGEGGAWAEFLHDLHWPSPAPTVA
jgi:hypothetical protein